MFKAVMLHEFGHIVGLEYSPISLGDPPNVMDYSAPFANMPLLLTDHDNAAIVDLCFHNDTPVGIEDYIYISLQNNSYYTNTYYFSPYIQSNFVDEYPYGDYIVSWEGYKIYANYGCSEVLIMDETVPVHIPTLPMVMIGRGLRAAK